MPSLSLTNTEVKARLAMVLGVDRDSANWDANLTADVDRIIRSGLRRFYSANDWKFLRRHYPIPTVAPKEDGTVTIVSGVVTFSGATALPSDVDSRYLFTTSTGVYEIDTRDSDSQLTLIDTSVDADAGSSYALYKHRYDLPTNFGGFVGPVAIGNDTYLRETAVIPEFEIRGLQNLVTVQTGQPKLFAISHTIADEDLNVPTYYMEVWPLPDAVYVVDADIKLVPGDTLSGTDSTTNTHPAFSNVILEAILTEGEVAMGVSNGVHEQRFLDALVGAVEKDRRMNGVRRSLARRRDMIYDPLYYLKTGTSSWPGE